MKRILPALLIPLALAGAAGCKKYSGEKAAEQRGEWHQSLADSIAGISARRVADSVRLEELHTELAERIASFTQVSNPREVEPYYILARFRGRYPLSSTGIAARMTAGEQAEVIAALSGHRFDAIRVQSGAESAQSQTVPADQALNYTSGGLTTVAFSGAEADSVCMLVASHRADPVTLSYLQGGSPVKSITLSADQKDWIAATWDVCGAHKEARMLERRMLTDSRKLELLRITLDQDESKKTE